MHTAQLLPAMFTTAHTAQLLPVMFTTAHTAQLLPVMFTTAQLLPVMFTTAHTAQLLPVMFTTAQNVHYWPNNELIIRVYKFRMSGRRDRHEPFNVTNKKALYNVC